MFNLRDFIMRGLKESVGHEADYKVIENATGWFDKGVLKESDLEDLNNLLDSQEESIVKAEEC